MSWILLASVMVVFCLVLAVLGYWQRAVQSAEDQHRAAEACLAEQEGAHRALTQHPQIDTNRCLGCGTCVAACPEHGVLALVEGKARLVRAANCVGHAACEAACPVGALTVGLGNLAGRKDIPLLTDERETSVPGVFIAGELSGIGLIRNAIAQGTEIVDTIQDRLKQGGPRPSSPDLQDVLIVGCGPSGIAATLRAHELGLNYTVIDQDVLGGTVRKYPRNKMTLTQPVEIPLYGRMKGTQYSKESLIEMWETVFKTHNITVRAGVKFTGLSTRNNQVLEVETSAGPILCRHCILALGRRGTPRKLGVAGEESEKVLYQLVDAADHANQNLLVVGGGDSAIEAALALAAQPGNTVTISYRRDAIFRIKPRNREALDKSTAEGRIRLILSSNVHQITSSEIELRIDAKDGSESTVERIPYDYVFVLAGGEPPYPLLQKAGVAFGGDERTPAEPLREIG